MERMTYAIGGASILLLGAGGWVWAEKGGARPAEVVEFVPTTRVVAALVPFPVVAPNVRAPEIGVPVAVSPSFDVVRVGPGGSAVIAGRAAPGAEVVVREGGRDVARARAGRDGTFVALPAAPLAAGGRELTLAARDGASGGETKGDGSVLLVVPNGAPVGVAVAPPASPSVAPDAAVERAPRAAAPVVALLVPDAGRPRMLEGPRVVAGGPTLDTVDYDDAGLIRFSGGGAAGQAVRVYLDNLPSGEVRPDEHGRWVLSPDAAVPPGVHSLRVDQVDGRGRVVARVEVPFERASMTVAALAAAEGRVVVQPGQNLWRLARAAYGRGVQYRVIYLANREQIRDPQRIYPGQVFAVPAVATRDGG